MNKSNYLIYMPLFYYFIIISISTLPFYIKKINPIFLLSILMMLTLFITMNMNILFKSWLPYIIFLTIIGGLMIIFLYIISLINNNLFKFNMKTFKNNIFKMSISILIFLYLIMYIKYFIYFNLNNFNLMNDQINMNLLYKEFFNKSTLYMMLYLYYTMICIMSICLKYKAPLRQLMN